MKKYLIKKIETCPECEGDRFVSNLDWQEVNMAFDAWMKEHDKVCMDDEAYAEWDRRIKEKWPYSDPPSEEEPCTECEGEGEIVTWVPLQQALAGIERE